MEEAQALQGEVAAAVSVEMEAAEEAETSEISAAEVEAAVGVRADAAAAVDGAEAPAPGAQAAAEVGEDAARLEAAADIQNGQLAVLLQGQTKSTDVPWPLASQAQGSSGRQSLCPRSVITTRPLYWSQRTSSRQH